MSHDIGAALQLYDVAYDTVVARGFEREIAWQRSLTFQNFSETDLLREAAWVILTSGFRTSIVNRIFSYISLCFCDWESSPAILASALQCRMTALAALNYPAKIDAILAVADTVSTVGFGELKQRILENPINELQRFPFIGGVTSFHLAKNL